MGEVGCVCAFLVFSFFFFKGVRTIFLWQFASWTSTAIPWGQLAQKPRPCGLNWGACGHVVVTGNVHKEAALSHALLWILGASGALGPADFLGCAVCLSKEDRAWVSLLSPAASHKQPVQTSPFRAHCALLGVLRCQKAVFSGRRLELGPPAPGEGEAAWITSDTQMTASLWQKAKKN